MVYLVKFFLWMLYLLPAGAPYWLSQKGAGLLMRLSPVKRHTTERNLERCYPEMGSAERERLARASFQHYLCSILESGHNWYWSRDKLESRCDGVTNLELFLEVKDSGKGLLALAPHFGAWEYLGVYLQALGNVAILYKPPSNPGLEKALIERRSKGGGTLIPATTAGLLQLYAHLRDGKSAGVLPDQQPPAGKGRFVPFFGNPAFTSDLVPRLVKRSDSIVFATVCERLPGGRFKVHLMPADPEIYADDLDTAMVAMNRMIERCVAIDPAQYLWSYRRFKAQPEGAAPFYDFR
jgi:KDO2-lipid IV(A) lauroyltransferase